MKKSDETRGVGKIINSFFGDESTRDRRRLKRLVKKANKDKSIVLDTVKKIDNP